MKTSLVTGIGIAGALTVSAFLLSPAAKASPLQAACHPGAYGQVMKCCEVFVGSNGVGNWMQRSGETCRQMVVCTTKKGKICKIKKQPPPPVILREIVDEPGVGGTGNHNPPPGGGGNPNTKPR